MVQFDLEAANLSVSRQTKWRFKAASTTNCATSEKADSYQSQVLPDRQMWQVMLMPKNADQQ
jgi:hypothetical protein